MRTIIRSTSSGSSNDTRTAAVPHEVAAGDPPAQSADAQPRSLGGEARGSNSGRNFVVVMVASCYLKWLGGAGAST